MRKSWLLLVGLLIAGCGKGEADKPVADAKAAQGEPSPEKAPANKNNEAPGSTTASPSAKNATEDAAPAKTAPKGNSPAPKEPPAAEKKPPAPEKTALQEPATVAQILKVLDPHKLPRLSVKQRSLESPTRISYVTDGSIAAAEAFYVAELNRLGWKRLEGGTPSTDQYADALFSKDGFTVRLTLGAGGDGEVSVGLYQIGNLDVRTLPRLADAEIPEGATPSPLTITCRTKLSVAEASAACRDALVAAGWRVYTELDPGPSLDRGDSVEFNACYNGLRLMVLANHISYEGKEWNSFSYIASEALPCDLPLAKDAKNLKLDMMVQNAEYESGESIADLAAHYRKTAADYDLKVRAADSVETETFATLYLEGANELGLAVRITTADGGTKVRLERMSFKQETKAEEEPAVVSTTVEPEPMPESEPLTESESTSAAKSDDEEEMDDEVAKELQRAKNELAKLKGKVPAGALDDVEGLIDEAIGGKKKAAATDVKDEDEDEDDEDEDDEDEDDDEDDDDDDEDMDDDDSDDKPAAPALEVAKSRGEIDADAISKKGTACVVTLGDKKVTLKHAVAVHYKNGDKIVPAVLFASKAFNKAKLAKAIASGGNFAGFEVVDGFDVDYMEIRLAADGDYLSYSCSVEGASISSGGTDIQGAFRLDGEKLVGQTSLSGDEAFGKPFGFEATFDVTLAPLSDKPAAPAGELVRDTSAGTDLPVPDGIESMSSEGSPYRKAASTSIEAPLAKVAEFYQRELSADGWKPKGKPDASDPDVWTHSYSNADGRLTVKLTKDGNATKIELLQIHDSKAEKDGVKPPKGKGRVVLGNASKVEIVVTIEGKDYKLAAGAGAEDPKDALKVDLEPGKHTVSIKPKGGDAQTEEIDLPADAAWGVIQGPGGAISLQLY